MSSKEDELEKVGERKSSKANRITHLLVEVIGLAPSPFNGLAPMSDPLGSFMKMFVQRRQQRDEGGERIAEQEQEVARVGALRVSG